MERYSIKLKIFVILITIISLLFGIYLYSTHKITDIPTLFLFVILSIIAESLLIPLASGGAVSVGFAISLSMIIIQGPFAAYLVNGLGVLLRYVRNPKKGNEHLFNRPIIKTLFNTSQCSISSGFAGILYILAGGKVGPSDINITLISILAIVFGYLAINTLLLSKLMSLLSNQSFTKMWVNNIKGMIPSAIAVGMLGIIIALAYISYGAGAVLLFFGPLLLARYSFKLYMDMRRVYMDTIHALTKAVEAKDPYTSGHASRVQEYAVKLAKVLNLSDKQIENIKTAALLHDIGKIGIDDNILKKPGKLTEEEYHTIQQHPVIGAQIIKDVDLLKDVVDIIKYHHERYDGKGYPEGIKGDDIPLEAAILSIADVYDAMTSDRTYRRALTKEQAINEIERNMGSQFNPVVAKAFINILEEETQGGSVANAS